MFSGEDIATRKPAPVRERASVARVEAQPQQPKNPERPKTPVEAIEQIKQELTFAENGFSTCEEKLGQVAQRLEAVERRFQSLNKTGESAQTVLSIYQDVIAERSRLAEQYASFHEKKTKLRKEYDPFERAASAVNQIQSSSEAITNFQRRSHELWDERTSLQAQLSGYEAQTTGREMELRAQQVQLQQEIQQRQAAYAATLAERTTWCEANRFYLPLAYDENRNVRPGYEQFIATFTESQNWIQQVNAHLAEPQNRAAQIAAELNGMDQYRMGLKSALGAAEQELRQAMAGVSSEDLKLRQAQAVQEQATIEGQEAIYRRMNPAARSSPTTATPQAGAMH